MKNNLDITNENIFESYSIKLLLKLHEDIKDNLLKIEFFEKNFGNINKLEINEKNYKELINIFLYFYENL